VLCMLRALVGGGTIRKRILTAGRIGGVERSRTCLRMTTVANEDVSEEERLLVQKLSEKATVPTRGSEQAAGYDLYAAHEEVIPACGHAMVKTDIAVAIPKGCYGRIAPRSGLARKHIDLGAGVVDADYRGNVGVIMFNHAKEDLQVKTGDRIAQLILERICMAPIVEVESLDETARGAKGFGSTGGMSNPVNEQNPAANENDTSPEKKKQKTDEETA